MRTHLPLLLLAAGAAQAAAAAAALPAKPPSEEQISDYRSRGYPVCLRVNPLVARNGTVNEDAIEQCYCALDRLIAERRIDDLRRLDAGNVRALLGPALEQCRNGAPAAAKLPTAPDADMEALLEAARADSEALEEQANAVREASELASKPMRTDTEPDAPPWVSPAWLAWTGLPGWALWLLPIFAALIGLVLLLTRRRGGRRGDLVAPPPSLRGDPGSRPPDRG